MTVADHYSAFTARSSRIRTPSVLDYLRPNQGSCDLTLAEGSSFISSQQLSQLTLDGSDHLTSLKYDNVQGNEMLREALSVRHLAHPDKILITNGASEALFLVLGCIVQRGAKVLVPRPSFPAYEALVEFWGGAVEPYELRADNGYSMESLVDRIGCDTSALIMNSPHNPTGACIVPSVFRAVLNRADEFGCWVLSDEVYDVFHFDGFRHKSLLQLIEPETGTRHVVIQSFSKRENLPGIRLGYTIAQDPRLISRMLDIKTHQSMGTSILSQQLALKAMKLEPAISVRLIEVLEKHRNLLARAIHGSGVPFVRPRGGFYFMVNDPNVDHDETILFNHFRDLGVVGLPGSVFKSPEPSLRLSLLVPTVTIEKACEFIMNSDWRSYTKTGGNSENRMVTRR